VITQVVALMLLLTGAIELGYSAYVTIDANAYQAIEHQRLERARQQAGAALSDRHDPRLASPISAVIEGASIGEIRIPRLGLKAIIAQGESPGVLRRAVGHLADTPLPGEWGNVVLAGHRDTFFRALKQIQAGDAITLNTQSGSLEYLVEWSAIVGPGDVAVTQSTRRRSLTLITCHPFSYVGPAPERFVVRARETSRYSGSNENRTTFRR
jgi:LPXTG-site transpeptidase (sortase) family protein